jgi:soluble lytic murein transglycosylase
MAQQLATLRTPAAYAGVPPTRTATPARPPQRLPGAGPRLPARQALCRGETALARLGAPTESWPTTRTFSTPRQATMPETIRLPRTSCTDSPSRYPDSIFDAQAPELEANVLLAMNNRRRAPGAGGGAGTDSAEPPGFQLAEGRWSRRWASNRLRSHLQAAAAGHPLSPEAQIARAKLTRWEPSRCIDHGGPAQPGRRLLQRRPLRRGGGAVSRAGARAGPGCTDPQRICRGRGGLRAEAEAADPAEVRRCPTRDDENGARRLYLLMELARDRDDGRSASKIVTRWSRGFRTARGWPRRSSPAATCTCSSATIPRR